MSSIELTESQRMILQELVDLFRDSENAVKGEAIAEQIFEPFVSGRENGTGLGLALVAKIAADHGGLIGVDSRPGRTIFRLSLPRL